MRFLVDSAGGMTPFSPEASFPPPRDTGGLFCGLGLEMLLPVEFNDRDNELKFVMIITGGLEFVRGRHAAE